ncbi:MAG: DUF3987 domain-containing protein [Nitrospirales bacterium]|nr:DUF3987 domain-containing protein [Nitrospirales bacterium]
MKSATMNAVAEFQAAMKAHGLACPDAIIGDGKLHRYHVKGDSTGTENGWYVFHNDECPAGIIGSWKTGERFTWSAKSKGTLSPSEREKFQARIQAAKAEAERERQRLADEAATRARDIWEQARPATEHLYLSKKHVQAHGTRVYEDCLVVPAYGDDGQIKTLQFIGGDGQKKFLRDGAKRGNYFTIGKPGDLICISEGFATAASIHETTGGFVVVAFDAGNLRPVAERIRQKYPEIKIIIAADNDSGTEVNQGIAKGREAAAAVNGSVVFPTFSQSSGNGKPFSDFNDLCVAEGIEAVREQLQPREPAAPTHNDAMAWPELDGAALHGLAGDVVTAILPYTEADGVTLLVHLISEFSCIIGRGPHIRLDGDYVPLLFWPVVVGDTSKSRKGSGGKRIKRLYEKTCPEWTRGLHSGSLSSGEGLIYAVRDEEYGENKQGERVLKDEGVEDKRLYLVQAEFGAMLRIMARDGNSLSGYLRDAWDGSTLKPMTKGNRIQATRPHIGVAGHVTKDELLRNLNGTEMANGFGNRFVWFCVQRSKFLPFATDPPLEAMDKITARLRQALQHAATVEEVGMTVEAQAWWRDMYAELSQGTLGLAGSLLDRAEAQVRRLAALYAILDLRRDVDEAHLLAALSLWNYSASSVKWIFGEKIGDPVEDTILEHIRQSGSKGLTDTQISSLFSRHESTERLGQAKQHLQNQGLIESKLETTKGRSITTWLAKKAKQAKKEVCTG